MTTLADRLRLQALQNRAQFSASLAEESPPTVVGNINGYDRTTGRYLASQRGSSGLVSPIQNRGLGLGQQIEQRGGFADYL